MQALVVPVGAAWHAVEMAAVREVVHAAPTMPVPFGPSWLVGLVNLRGEIVPVVDSGEALGGERVDAPTHLILVDVPGGKAALAASGPPMPTALGEPSGASEHHGGRGRYTIDDDRVASLLDLDALWSVSR